MEAAQSGRMLRAMLRHLALLTACLSACPGLTAGDAPAEAKLTPAATAALDALQHEIGKDYAAYHAAVQKASERAGKDLQKAMTDATRKGDLTTATAIRTLLDDLGAGKLQTRLETQVKADVDLLGDLPPNDDVLHANLIKGDWILDRSGNRVLLRFDHWAKAEGDPTARWNCSVAPDLAIDLINGIRLHARAASLGLDAIFVSDPKTGYLVAENGWVIRRNGANEDLPDPLDGDPGSNKVRVRRKR